MKIITQNSDMNGEKKTWAWTIKLIKKGNKKKED